MTTQAPSSNWLHTLTRPLISPRQFDFWARELGSIAAWQRVYARVTHRHQESANTLTLTLNTNRNLAPVLPGQHITVSAEINGRRISRCYSQSVPSQKKGQICITVRREPQGLMSNWLHDHATTGTVVELSQGFGDLGQRAITGSTQTGAHEIYLAAGSGITAIASLIIARAQQTPPMTGALLYWEKSEDRFCFTNHLNEVMQLHPDFRIHRICTGKLNAIDLQSPARGRISEDLLSHLTPDLDNAEVFACGGYGFIDTARSLIAPRSAMFHAEAFTPPEKHVSTPHGQATSNSSAQGKRVALTLRKSGRQLDISTEDNLLDALEAEGITAAHGCRSGICNTCSCQQLSGNSNNTVTGLDQSGHQHVRLCVSRATGAIELDL